MTRRDTADALRRARCAALGARAKDERICGASYETCRACGTSVRWDLRDHKFFGFANTCPMKRDSA